MFKKLAIVLLICIIATSSACSEVAQTNLLSTQEAKEFLSVFEKEIDKKVPTQTPKWFSATVISTTGGTATVHLPTDPVGTDITVQNPRELPLEIGDEVYIVAVDGKLSNAFVDLRKNITLNTIYVDYNTGIDDYKHGSSSAPFKTLQYAVNRLPKNLNDRWIEILYNTVNSSEELIIDNIYGGGLITIEPNGSFYRTIDEIQVIDCISPIEIRNLEVNTRIYIWRSNNITLSDCKAIANTPFFDGINIYNSVGIFLDSCVVSNKSYGIYSEFSTIKIIDSTISNNASGIVANINSSIFTKNNTGNNSQYGLWTSSNSTIGKNGTQPTGTTANELADSSSVIR